MTEQTSQQSVRTQHRAALSECTWETISEPGAYVELGSGDLYRVPKEALNPGESPVINKESRGASRLAQISRNPFVTTMHARLICAQNNIEPNF